MFLLNISKAISATTNKLGGISPTIPEEGREDGYYSACHSTYSSEGEKTIAVLKSEVGELHFWLDSKLSIDLGFFISDALKNALVVNDITGWKSQNYWQGI